MPKIIINEDRCIRCGTCAEGCVLGILEKPTDDTFPRIAPEMEDICLKCGHCEAFCPREALVLDYQREEKLGIGPHDGVLDPLTLELYLKKRRSVRHFTDAVVPRETVARILDTARWAASGGNQQPVKWIVVSDAALVRRIAGLTIDWMRSILDTDHPLAPYVSGIIAMWEAGADPICHRAPHLLFAHVPRAGAVDDPTEAVIAMTHVDLAAPAFGLGTCWAGFVKMAAETHEPLQAALELPADRFVACAMLFGFPRHRVMAIPRRNPADITWR